MSFQYYIKYTLRKIFTKFIIHPYITFKSSLHFDSVITGMNSSCSNTFSFELISYTTFKIKKESEKKICKENSCI